MNRIKQALSVLAMGPGLMAAAAASPVVITFDAGDPIGGLAAGSVLGNQYAASGVTFAPNAFSGSGGPTGDWASNTDLSIVTVGSSAAGSVGTPSLVSGNILRSFDQYLNENGDPSFTMYFSSAIDALSIDFAGVRTPGSVRLFEYSNDILVGVVTADANAPQQFTLGFSGSTLINKVVVTPGDYDDWVGLDNIRFNVASAVPEPSTYALLASAGLAALLVRRRSARA